MTSWPTPRSSVAENSSRWPPAGVASRIRVTAGMKPRSAMWSASSRIVISMSSSVQAPRSSRSIRRPGVATTRSTPRRIRVDLPADRDPAVDGRHGDVDRAAQRLQDLGDLDGQFPGRDQDQGPGGLRAAAAVRPAERPRRPAGPARAARRPASCRSPVCALPRTSRPLRASGSARDWMANGPVIPRSASAVTSASGMPRAANVVGSGGGAASAAASARSSSEGALLRRRARGARRTAGPPGAGRTDRSRAGAGRTAGCAAGGGSRMRFRKRTGRTGGGRGRGAGAHADAGHLHAK